MKDETNETVAQQLARFVAGLCYKDIPKEVVARSKLCILDQLGVQLVASTLKWNKLIYRYVKDHGGRQESTVINFGTKVPAQDAAFVNATFGQGCELDDVLNLSHPGAASVPAALAVAEREGRSGQDLITAVVIGYEIICRIAAAIHPHHGNRGFQAQGTVGPFAAAAVAGKLLELNEEQMSHAFAIAGSHSSGIAEYTQSGGEVKRMHSGLGVRSGIQSAILAEMGLTGPLTVIEGKRGFCQAFAGNYNLTAITESLGKQFSIMNTRFKIHPVAGGQISSIDTFSELIAKHDLSSEDIQEISVGVGESSKLNNASIYEPKDASSAQFSLAFSLALRLIKGSNDLSFYTDPSMWSDSQVLATARKVKIYVDSEAREDKVNSSRINIKLVDGRTLGAYQPYRKGSFENPLTDKEIKAKARGLVSRVISEKVAKEIITMVDNLPSLTNVLPLVQLTTQPSTQAEAGSG